MQIDVTYALGDTVWFGVKQNKVEAVACDACTSTGIVVLAGAEYACPKCHGGRVTSEKEWVVKSGVVRRVRATKCTEVCHELYDVESSGRLFLLAGTKLHATKLLAEAAVLLST